MHTYRNNHGLNWTVGYYTNEHQYGNPLSRWHPLRDYETEAQAMMTVCMLNGGEHYAMAYQTGKEAA